jgi:hypothetical protein
MLLWLAWLVGRAEVAVCSKLRETPGHRRKHRPWGSNPGNSKLFFPSPCWSPRVLLSGRVGVIRPTAQMRKEPQVLEDLLRFCNRQVMLRVGTVLSDHRATEAGG